MRLRLLFVFSIVFFVTALAFMPQAHTQSAQKIKSEEELVQKQMVEISRHLGVTCTECHKVDNFKDASKPSHQVAKDHIRITELLKANGMDGKKGPLATCYMCHLGHLKPVYREGQKRK